MNKTAENAVLTATRRLPLARAALSESYYYSSLALCISDAVFSIGVRYGSTKRVVERVIEATSIERDRRIALDDPLRLDAFLQLCAANPVVFGSKQRTSTRGGILKSEAVVETAKAFLGLGILSLGDFQQAPQERLRELEGAMRSVRGQHSGISWNYLQMLAGDDNQVKPDRHIMRFIADATGLRCSPEQAVLVIRRTCLDLLPDFPQMTPRLLDHEIWKHQSRQ